MASSSYIQSDSDISTNINSDTELNNTQTSSNTNYENSKYNQLSYKLPESSVYIFKNGLFTRSLLDIDISKDR